MDVFVSVVDLVKKPPLQRHRHVIHANQAQNNRRMKCVHYVIPGKRSILLVQLRVVHARMVLLLVKVQHSVPCVVSVNMLLMDVHHVNHVWYVDSFEPLMFYL
jgi:hypothetical protein